MKRFLLSMAALLTIAGCAQQEELVSADLGATNAPEFGVGIETSRVAVAEDGENYVMSWAAGDRVSVFFNDGGNSEYKFAGETGATSGVIKAVNAPQGEALANFYAIYPYAEGNSLEGDVLSFTLPAEQQYIPNTFAPGVNTMVATTTDETKSNFSFSNVCGYLRLKIYGDATIKSIKIEGNNGEIIAGAATYNMTEETLTITGEGKAITLNCGEGVALGATEAEATSFWFVVPATTFEKGLTVTMTDAAGTSMTQVLGTAFTIERNNVHSGVANYVANNIDVLFDARFNADGTATNIGSMSGLDIVSPIGGNVITHKRGDNYVAVFNNIGKDNGTHYDGFYYVDYTANELFKEKLKNGFTLEVLCKVNNFIGDFWATPFSLSTCRVHHNKVENNNKATWSLVASAPENNWGKPGIFNGWYWDKFSPVTVNAYQHVVLTYDGVKSWDMIVNGVKNGPWDNTTALNPGNALAIGGIAYTEGRACHLFCGEIAIARIYDSAKSVDEVVARYNELKPTIETLNAADNPPAVTANTLTPLVDVTFSTDDAGAPKATDTVSNSPITVEQMEGSECGISVANDVASFSIAEADGKYTKTGDFKVDYSAIKDAINDGFTIEVIHSCRDFGGWWKGLFGNNGYYLKDYGAKHWTMWAANEGGGWTYLVNSNLSKADSVYYHSVFVYNRESHTYSLYTNGGPDGGFGWTQHVDTDYVMIGAAPDNDSAKPHNYWQGNIAMFRIYDEPANILAAIDLYKAAQAHVESLNGN